MYAILDWCDGFGNDTIVIGIFDDLEKARAQWGKVKNLRYQKIELNTEIEDLDYYSAKKL